MSAYRLGMNLTQEELASRARISYRSVSDIERGVSAAPRQSTARALAEAFDLTGERRDEFMAAWAVAWTLIHPRRSHIRSGTPQVNTPTLQEPELFGRRSERERIGAFLIGLGPPVLTLAGEPGIGKSRLLGEALEVARQAGMAILSGACDQSDGQHPYAPIAQALEGYLRTQTRSERRRLRTGCEATEALLPVDLRIQTSRSATDWQATAERERWLLFDAVARLVARIAAPNGALLALDDLQWAPPDGLALLSRLVPAVEKAQPGRLRTLIALRDTPRDMRASLQATLLAFARAELGAQLTLQPLDDDAATALLRDEFADMAETNAERVIAQIVARGGGIPFYLLGLARAARQNTGAAQAGTIPWTITGMIQQRINALSEAAIDLLHVAAVAGRHIPVSLLIAASGIDVDEVIAAIEETYAARLLVEISHGACMFPHDLYREVILANLSSARKEQIHQKIAVALEAGVSELAPEPLAFHFANSADQASALRNLERVAERALKMRAYDSAEANYHDALTRATALDDARASGRLRARLGDLYIGRGRFDTALATLEAAIASYEQAGDYDAAGLALARLGWAHAFQGTSAAGLERLAAWADAETLARRGLLAQSAIFCARAALLFTLNRYGEQLEEAKRALTLARKAKDISAEASANRQTGMALAMLGRLKEALPVLQETLALAEQTGDLQTYTAALNDTSDIFRMRGEARTFQAYITRSVTAAERLGDLATIAFVSASYGDAAYLLGDWKTARSRYERAVQLARELGDSWATPYPLLALGRLDLNQGRETEGLALLHEALTLARQSNDQQALRNIQPILAERDLLRDAPEKALADLQRLLVAADGAGEVCEKDVTALLPVLAWAQVATGDEESAVATLDRCQTQAETMGAQPILVDVSLVRALLRIFRMREGDFAAADTMLREALRMALKMSNPYTRAKALYLYGLLDIARNRLRTAHQRLKAAQALCDRLDERLYRRNIVHALRRLASGGSVTPRVVVR